MFITLTEDHVKTGITGPEIAAARSAALSAGQTDPVPEEIAQVTREVRGRVAACSKNTLGPAGTIPDEAKTAAIDIVVYRLCKRVPGKALLTDQRVDAKKMADSFLTALSRCEVAIEQPTTPSTEITAGAAGEIVSTSCRTSTRRNLDRL
ncbi:MAG TPA: hypothetical protein VK985_09560 [Rariglobus sp.]|nr:hypothetical protein [Rariglobus sp.]